jgi:hypothetical protein
MFAGEVCESDKSKNYKTTYEMECLKDQKEVVFDVLNQGEVDIDKCENTIKIRTTEACPKLNYYIITYFLNEYKIYAGIVIIIIGSFLVFFGIKFIKVSVLVVTTLITITVLFIIYFNIFHPTSVLSVWILLGVGTALGLLLGFVFRKMVKGFILIIGGYIGYLISIFLYDILLNNIHASPQVIFWLTTVGCVVVFALLALWMSKVAVAIATAIIGSYMVIRGASFYLGKFPSESLVMDLISNEEWESLEKVIK